MEQNNKCHPLLNLNEILPIIDKIAIFGGLTEIQLHILFKLLDKAIFEKNEIIFKQGDPPSHIYIIVKGKVKLVIQANSTPLELIELEIGKCLGETALLSYEPHTATAITVAQTELIVLSSKTLLALVKNHQDIFSIITMNLAREVSRRLNKTDNILLHYFSK